jgi:hypothetical protein
MTRRRKLSKEDVFKISRQFVEKVIQEGKLPKPEYIKGTPHRKQKLFINIENDPVVGNQDVIECLFGGAVGGGKTWTLLAAALKYVHVPHYSALLLRKNYPDLKQEGGVMSLSKEWLAGTDAKWNENDKSWTFPSGAVLRFGYLQTDNDKYRYLGGEYQFIGWDELTQHTEDVYRYLFSRVRKRKNIPVPLRVMSATNPGNIGAKWVYNRFIPDDFSPAAAVERDVWYKETVKGQITAFIPSLLEDNPYLDRKSYLRSLSNLDEVTRQQYLAGDWRIQLSGDILYTYSEPHTVISWSQFKKVFGTKSIPKHWRTGVYVDAGTTESHPCVISWFATAAQNSPVINGVPLGGCVFLYRGKMFTQTTARETGEYIKSVMRDEISQCTNWQMSHEASSERLEYNKMSLPFTAWPTGRTRGIEQLKNAFSLKYLDKPNPFKPELFGTPSLFLIVDDEELDNPATDAGLARWREEIVAYRWDTPKSGEPPRKLVPFPLFNDAIDTMRAAAADYFPPVTEKTLSERVLDVVESIQPMEYLETVTDEDYLRHLYTQRVILAEEARARLEADNSITPDWYDIS